MNGWVILLLVLLFCGFFGSIPTWSHSAHWGYGPSGGFGVVLLILVVLLLMGRL